MIFSGRASFHPLLGSLLRKGLEEWGGPLFLGQAGSWRQLPRYEANVHLLGIYTMALLYRQAQPTLGVVWEWGGAHVCATCGYYHFFLPFDFEEITHFSS